MTAYMLLRKYGTMFINDKKQCLYDSDFVGDVESVEVGRQTDVSLLDAIGTNQSVDFADVNLVQLLHRLLDLGLVGLEGKE